MDSPKKVTDIKSVSSRATIVFLTLIIVLIATSSYSAYAGWKSGEVNTKFMKPVRTFFVDLGRIWGEEMKKSDSDYYNPNYLPPGSTSVATSESNINEYSTNNGSRVRPTQVPAVQYIYPTFTPYPTAIPGRPGSKEWDDEFWKRWDEMEKHNTEMQQQVEENQRQFCIDNPTLCR